MIAVYRDMPPPQPSRFLLADDPGAGKTAGLLIQDLLIRWDNTKPPRPQLRLCDSHELFAIPILTDRYVTAQRIATVSLRHCVTVDR